MAQPPVIFLAFANEQEDLARYLRNLPKEMKQARDILEAAEREGLCELVVRPNAGIEEIINTFQDEHYRGRIAVFHYGGHADGFQLLLEAIDGSSIIAHGEGLVSFLGGQHNLQLAFLNGCSTQQQAEELIASGVPAVIGTSQSIADDAATQLAVRFYQGLSRGISLKRAWKEAVDEQKIRHGQGLFRDIVIPDLGQPDQLPWDLYIRDGAENVNDWNLPEAARNPLFGLPKPPPADLPDAPYRFLDRYHSEQAEIFFGRSYYIRTLFEQVTNSQSAPALLLYGKSGVGKSSLLEAGLFPRLQETAHVIHIRRDNKLGFPLALRQQLAASAEVSERQAWKRMEEQHQKPVVVILDQVEEIFTLPLEENSQELVALFEIAQAIFKEPKKRPQGKLIFAYRKEFHPEILNACRQYRLPREECYIKPLSREDIIEIVQRPVFEQ